MEVARAAIRRALKADPMHDVVVKLHIAAAGVDGRGIQAGAVRAGDVVVVNREVVPSG